MNIDRLPPHSPEAECGVLGCILADNGCMDDCQAKLRMGAQAFYDMRHQTLYAAMCEVRDTGSAIDTITLQQHLKNNGTLEQVGGLSYLAALPDSVPSTANLPFYLSIIIEKYRLRNVISACTKAVASAYDCDGDPDSLLGDIQESFNALDGDINDFQTSKEVAMDMVKDLQRRYELDGNRSGLTTGLYDFDSMTDGLQFGEQTIVAARPSQGKTALACNVVQRVALMDNIPTVFVTLEMSPAALLKRIFSAWGRISMKTLRTGRMDEGEFAKLQQFSVMIKSKPIYFVNAISGMNITQIVGAVRRLWRRHGIKCVVIDYLQKIRPVTKNEKRTYEVGEVSGLLKALADETKVALLTLAQLNRENIKDKGRLPRMSDLADSGQIERDADTIALIHRPDPQQSEAFLIIGKQRDGECGRIALQFNGKYCQFENPTNQQEPT